jgi:SAM-dependent methyltransferase
MDPLYAKRYRELYERHWWWRARERMILDELERLAPLRGSGRILDVGCGDGLFFDRLRQFGVVEGVEPDLGLITDGSGYRDAIFVGTFEEFLPKTRYSLIVMLDVLEHLENPMRALRHAVRMVEPDGKILVTVPAFRALWTQHDVLNAHVTRFTRRTFDVVARDAGFRTVRQRYLFHWMYPVKLAVRFKEAVIGGRSRMPAVPSPPMNDLLLRLSLLEDRVLGPLRLPFGNSLLVVGEAR